MTMCVLLTLPKAERTWLVSAKLQQATWWCDEEPGFGSHDDDCNDNRAFVFSLNHPGKSLHPPSEGPTPAPSLPSLWGTG